MEIALLDGGLGQEINSRSSADTSHPAWSVKVMHDEPEIVVDVHKAFMLAGAKTLTLNNYAATATRLKRDGLYELFEQTHQQAIDLMMQAVEQSGLDRNSINIAGCLPPIGGSYDASFAPGYSDCYEEYNRLIALQKDGVDLFLIETMSNIAESCAAIDALVGAGEPVYIGLTLSDTDLRAEREPALRSGERLVDALEQFSSRAVEAVMINCCYPETVAHAIPVLQQAGLRWGAYANGFTAIDALTPGSTVDNLQAREDLEPEIYASHVFDWIDAGATIVGGCCEIGPHHIEVLHQMLTDKDYVPVKLR